MQFRDLKRQYQAMKKDIDNAMIKVATDCNFINGQPVKALEEELSDYVGVKHCITCANGTDALSMAMMAWNIGEGDAVFVPDFTFFSSGEIVLHAGATPVFVDIDKMTYNISTDSLERQIKATIAEGKLKPKVIVAVDLFGLPANYPEIIKIAEKYDLLILEDGAQGFGGEINGKKACGFGDINTTSFFPAKPLGCYGDGGAIFTDDDEIAVILKSIRAHGKGEMKYDNVRIGLNSRLDTIQAAILLVKLRAFREFEIINVNDAAAKYTECLEGCVIVPNVPPGFYSSWAQYTIQLKNRDCRDRLQTALKEKGIPSMVYYPKPMHKQEVFSHMTFKDIDFINSMQLVDTVLSLPMHPYMTEEDIMVVSNTIKEFMR